MMRKTRTLASTLSASLLCLGAAQAASAQDGARYQVTFERTWSAETHPKDFPLLAHFSPVIGQTHAPGQALFQDGGTPTPGLERLCEHLTEQVRLTERLRADHHGLRRGRGRPGRNCRAEQDEPDRHSRPFSPILASSSLVHVTLACSSSRAT